MLPMINMPEPMQEAVPAFGTGGLAATCSTTECCCCTVLAMTSGAFAAAFLSFSGALLLKNMSTSAAGMQCRKSLRLSCRDQPQTEGSQVRMPFENRTAQTRTATTMEPTIASHSVSGPVSGFSFPHDSPIAPPLRPKVCHPPVPRLFVKKNWDNCGAWGPKLLKKSSSVAFQSQECSEARRSKDIKRLQRLRCCARRKRQRSRRAAEQRDELAPM